MSSAISKRQQARNERALQDLIQNVPGNNRCADCAANNPGWSSWSLGIFLCMRCAALHRKLGTHISKVKSLSMDSWTVDQVENMRKMGNVSSNKLFNPHNARPEISVEVDEVDGAMEKFIRQKYEQRAYMHGATVPQPLKHHTGSTGTGSWPDDPPELPPKPGKRFGFSLRSSSSTTVKSRADRFTPPLSPVTSYDKTSVLPPRKPNKTSNFFGKKSSDNSNDFDAKLAMLRDMGFYDSRKCADVLQSMKGDLDRTVETLTRLGENEKPLPRSPDPSIGDSETVSATVSPKLAVDKTRRTQVQPPVSDPWQTKELPQRSATMPLSQNAQPAQAQPPTVDANSWNPFLSQSQSSQSVDALTNSFHQMQTTNPWGTAQAAAQPQSHQQPAYPPSASPHPPFQTQTQPFPQSTNNPWQTHVPISQQPLSASNTGQYAQYAQQAASPTQAAVSSNPFLRTSRSFSQLPANPWLQQSSSPFSSLVTGPSSTLTSPGHPWSTQMTGYTTQSPVAQSPASPFGVATSQNASSSQSPAVLSANNPFQSYFQQPRNSDAVPQTQQTTPWTQSGNQMTSQHMPQFQQNPSFPMQSQHPNSAPQQTFTQPFVQPTGSRVDNNSILALYNAPNGNFRPLQTLPEDPTLSGSQMSIPQPTQAMPPQQANTTNPFGHPTANMPAPFNGQPNGPRHVSNESMAFVGLGGGGRHSPDAFAGLSAQYTRT